MNILIADDHYLYVQGIRLLLEEKDEVEQLLEAEDLSSVLEQLGQQPIDLLLLDLKMPGMDGFNGVYQILETFPDLPVVIVSSSESHIDIQTVRNAGVAGFISKSLSPDEMVTAFSEVIAGRPFFPELIKRTASPLEQLTQRQIEILYLINGGMGNREIAAHLKITEGTVSQHIHSILRRLGVKRRAEAARILRDHE
ncbi:MAG: response regulator transcription factor [Gammaproteobacteria bacterium]|jgi:DNA-binding NarL/FixJ family response regulator|nr:response regulator transcription factor [Gammaproteobacteria bacterium]MBT7306885.1 response regulator transcription factor [Gammaproteobacteria bacterium]